MLLELTPELDEVALERALDALLTHHDALRTRFERVDGQWHQHIAPPEPQHRRSTPVEEYLCGGPADEVHAGFDLGHGPLLRAVLYQRRHLLLVAHHLVIDGVSWRILLEDLDTAYQQAAGGDAVDLGDKTDLVPGLVPTAAPLRGRGRAGPRGEPLVGRTRRQPAAGGPPRHATGSTAGDCPCRTFRWGDRRSAARGADRLPHQGQRRPAGALAVALSRWTGRDTVSIDLEGHGREELTGDVDLSRTVGWFTTIYPVRLAVADSATPRELVKSVRRQLRTVPGNGLGFGALRYLADQPTRDELTGGPPQIVFNYLGQWDQTTKASTGLYQAVLDSTGQESDPADRGAHLLEVVGATGGGELRFTWYFQPDRNERSTVEQVANVFAETLRWIAKDCGKLA